MTPPAKLTSLTVTAFRGSTGTLEINFDNNARLALIYGENGTGKTTICDAFEFLARGEIGSLKDKGIGAGLSKYWPTAGKSAGDVAVTLITSAGSCSGTIAATKVVVDPSNSRPLVEVLRRQMLLRLIEATPGERYTEIKRFIDITEFERSEDALRTLLTGLKKEQAGAAQSELQSLDQLNDLYENEGKQTGLNAVAWAEQRLAAPGKDMATDLKAVDALRGAHTLLIALPELIASASTAEGVAQAGAIEAERAEQAIIDGSANVDAEMVELLEAAQGFLHGHPHTETCPLCESGERAFGLADAVSSRLAALETLRLASDDRRKSHTTLANAKGRCEQVVASHSQAVAGFTAAWDGHAWPPEIAAPPMPVPTAVADLPAWIEEAAAAAGSWGDVEASWRTRAKSLGLLRSTFDRYARDARRRTELDGLIPRIDAAHTLCMAERQAFVDGIIGAIAKEVGELYEKVHPGEGLNKIALQLDTARRASLDLMGEFSGLDAPPQAYFSQSHLDTLGLCVFLALALRERPEETILILDDVLGSIDEPHVDRVIDMIYAVSARFRYTIVTTHYRPWRAKYQWGELRPDSPCQFIELVDWSIGQGMKTSSSLPEVARLRTMLAADDVDTQAICAKAGVILERMLDYLTLKYECAVPRRRGDAYTLGDLLPNIKGPLRTALAAERRADDGSYIRVPLKPHFDTLDTIVQKRNAIGAHFNRLADHFQPADAVAFANEVVALADAIICPDHGWPNNDKSGSYWRNGGDTRRLHPLKKPS